MDASCCLQESIHLLELIQLSMCPEIWVHIISGGPSYVYLIVGSKVLYVLSSTW